MCLIVFLIILMTYTCHLLNCTMLSNTRQLCQLPACNIYFICGFYPSPVCTGGEDDLIIFIQTQASNQTMIVIPS